MPTGCSLPYPPQMIKKSGEMIETSPTQMSFYFGAILFEQVCAPPFPAFEVQARHAPSLQTKSHVPENKPGNSNSLQTTPFILSPPSATCLLCMKASEPQPRGLKMKVEQAMPCSPAGDEPKEGATAEKTAAATVMRTNRVQFIWVSLTSKSSRIQHLPPWFFLKGRNIYS